MLASRPPPPPVLASNPPNVSLRSFLLASASSREPDADVALTGYLTNVSSSWTGMNARPALGGVALALSFAFDFDLKGPAIASGLPSDSIPRSLAGRDGIDGLVKELRRNEGPGRESEFGGAASISIASRASRGLVGDVGSFEGPA